MIDQRSPILRLLTLLLATVLGLFFALPMLWLITAPFNERATLSVSIPQPPSLANFEVVFNNQFAIRALFVNNLIIGGGVMVLIAQICEAITVTEDMVAAIFSAAITAVFPRPGRLDNQAPQLPKRDQNLLVNARCIRQLQLFSDCRCFLEHLDQVFDEITTLCPHQITHRCGPPRG